MTSGKSVNDELKTKERLFLVKSGHKAEGGGREVTA